MAGRSYTLLILFDAAVSARTLHLNATVLTAVSSVTALTMLGFAFLLYHGLALNVRLQEMKRLRLEASDRGTLAAKLGQYDAELTRLRDLDRRLRGMVGLPVGGDEGSQLTPGEFSPGSKAAPLDIDVKRSGHLRDWVSRNLEALRQEMATHGRSLRRLKELLEAKRARLASTPSLWPAQGRVTDGYGYRLSPFTGGRGTRA